MARNDNLERLIRDFTISVEKRSFIKDPETTISSYEENIVDDNLYSVFRVEAYRVIYCHNKTLLESLQKENSRLEKTISIETPRIQEETNHPKEELTHEVYRVERPIPILDFLSHTNDLDTITKCIDSLSSDQLPYIKLFYYKKMQELKNKITRLQLMNPDADISSLKNQFGDLSLIFDYINDEKKIEEQEVEEDISEIVLIPSAKYSSTIEEDILEYEDRFKEIKAAIDKIFSGYLKNKKSTKAIVGFDKLFEYTHPNGIRILFFLLPNNKIALCSLFFKDKQKSTKITNYYVEALSRFEEQKDTIISNLDDINFNIDQAEIIGELFQLLESRINSLPKKGSE